MKPCSRHSIHEEGHGTWWMVNGRSIEFFIWYLVFGTTNNKQRAMDCIDDWKTNQNNTTDDNKNDNNWRRRTTRKVIRESGCPLFFFFLFCCCFCCKWTVHWQFGNDQEQHTIHNHNKQRRKQNKQNKQTHKNKQAAQKKAKLRTQHNATQCNNKTASPITKRELTLATTNKRPRKEIIKNQRTHPMSAVVFIGVGESRFSIPPSIFLSHSPPHAPSKSLILQCSLSRCKLTTI